MTRIWDCLVFGTEDELPTLQCRLATLAGAVHAHIICEARWDFWGRPKPMLLADHASRFAAWDDRIVYVDAGPDVGQTAYARAVNQRNALAVALDQLDIPGDDILMYSDVDEIPRPEHAGKVGKVLGMTYFAHSLWWKAHAPWVGTTADYRRNVTDLWGLAQKRWVWPGVPDAGWHLSWMGGPEAGARKLITMADTPPEWFCKDVVEGTCWRDGWHWNGGLRFKLDAAVPGDWPPWCLENAPPEWARNPRREAA